MNKRQVLLFLPALLLSTLAAAQEAVAVAAPAVIRQTGILDWILNNLLLVVGIITLIGVLSALLNVVNMLMEVQRIRLVQEHGAELAEKVIRMPKLPSWQRLYNKAWSLVPVEREKAILLEHEHDGIRELDNVLPPWWLALFYITIIYSVGYMGYYHVLGKGQDQIAEYRADVEAADKAVKAYLAGQADVIDETNVERLTNADDLSLGATIFQEKCIACHGPTGGGNSIGPNLADEYWLHGGSISHVFRTVKYGVPEKGMIAWKDQLRASDIQRVASYILSLQGTNPPDAKEPQGELYEEEETAESVEN